MSASKAARENRLRKYAHRLGLILKKSRAKRRDTDTYPGYMIINAENHIVEAGGQFGLDLDAVEKYLKEYESKKKGLSNKH